MTARLALFVAPPDALLSTAPARLEALGWLRNNLAGRGFKIAIVAGGESPIAELEKVAANVAPGDVVFVHVSARLATRDSMALHGATQLPFSVLTETLAARSPGYVAMVLDLATDDDRGGEPDSTNLLAAIAQSLGATEHGYSVLAAVRPLAGATDRLAFTRLAMPPLDDDGPPSSEALLSAMHERVAAGDGAGPSAFMLFRGAPDTTIDGLVAQATQARDWRRVVELRLDRAETLATVAQRAQELTGVARILQGELRDADGAIEVLEHARSLDPKRAPVLEALRHAYEASGRAPPIDPAEYAKAFKAHKRAGQADAALLDAMLLEEVGAAEPEHLTVVEQSRSVVPMQALKPLDAVAWDALRAPGFDGAVASVLAGVHDAAVAARIAQLRSSRRLPSLDAGARLDAESTVSAVRTLHWAARVLGVTGPDVYAGTDDAGEAVAHVPGSTPSIVLAPRVLSGMSAKQLAFLGGRALAWYRPEYHAMLYYPALEDLRALLGPTLAAHLGTEGAETALGHWVRSAELTAARAGLLLCGELKTAVAGARAHAHAPGRPPAERVTSDLVAFCASRAHAELRAHYLRLPAQSLPPPSRGA